MYFGGVYPVRVGGSGDGMAPPDSPNAIAAKIAKIQPATFKDRR